MVVLLDWYAGHRTKEVEDLILNKGHLLLFHGGGCTPFGQVNDTHLHALVQQALVNFENDLAHRIALDMREKGERKFPKCTRLDILNMIVGLWESLDHTTISRKGYRCESALLLTTLQGCAVQARPMCAPGHNDVRTWRRRRRRRRQQRRYSTCTVSTRVGGGGGGGIGGGGGGGDRRGGGIGSRILAAAAAAAAAAAVAAAATAVQYT